MEKKEMKRIKILEGLQVTIDLIKTQYKEEVDFVTDFQADPEVEGNAAELNQVFMNILINACQAILEKQKGADDKLKGTITIQALEEKENAVIRFQDTGIGMSEEVKSKVFDPFFTTKSVGEGTGLGLSITYTIVEKHKGRMEVISKEGEGTTITLYIPHSLLKTDKKEKD
jgi:signal transduction histidine kinase